MAGAASGGTGADTVMLEDSNAAPGAVIRPNKMPLAAENKGIAALRKFVGIQGSSDGVIGA